MIDALMLMQATATSLIGCTFDSWQPRIGDPHIMGWITVLAYLGTAWLCLRVRMVGRLPQPIERFFWSMLAVLMLFLAINKQLDLQSAGTAVARCMAEAQGWYGARRDVQVTVILSLAAAAVAFGLICLWLLRSALARNGAAVAGLAFVLGFVLIRAVGFHHMDRLIGVSLLGVRMNWVFELSGLILISLNALWFLYIRLPKLLPTSSRAHR